MQHQHHHNNPWYWSAQPNPLRPRHPLPFQHHALQSHMSMANLSTPFPQPPPSPALSSESSSTIVQQQQQYFERLCELEQKNKLDREREKEREREREKEISKERGREREYEERNHQAQREPDREPQDKRQQQNVQSQPKQQFEWSRNPWRRETDVGPPGPLNISTLAPIPAYTASTPTTALPVYATVPPPVSHPSAVHTLSSAPSIPLLDSMASAALIIRGNASSPHDRSSDISEGDEQMFGVPLNSPPPITGMERESEWEREMEQERGSLRKNIKEGSTLADLLSIFEHNDEEDTNADSTGNDSSDHAIANSSPKRVGITSNIIDADTISPLKSYFPSSPVKTLPPLSTISIPTAASSPAQTAAPETRYLVSAPMTPSFSHNSSYGPHTYSLPPLHSSRLDDKAERTESSGLASQNCLPLEHTELSQIPITIITPAIIQESTKVIPSILTRMRWPPALCQRIYAWTIQHPKVALLFWMCDEMRAWHLASMYDLRDDMLPFSEEDLRGIASDPQKMTGNQWRVMCKELPRTGGHVEYTSSERLPLHSFGALKGARSKTDSGGGDSRSDCPRLDRVCWLSDTSTSKGTNKVYIRKRLNLSLTFHQGVAIRQLSKFWPSLHPNIDCILCSYSQSNSLGFVVQMADMNLEGFLTNSVPSSGSATSNFFPDREAQLLSWICDLSDALAFLHQQHIYHRSVRPRKILISGKRIYFSVFGVGESALFGPGLDLNQSSERDVEAYIYAAPELIRTDYASLGGGSSSDPASILDTSNPSANPLRPFSSSRADVFSLGCVFLSMISNIRGYRQSDFTAFRVGSGSDPSFHSNIPRVQAWMRQLRGARIPDIAVLLGAALGNSGSRTSGNSSSSNSPPSVSPSNTTPPSGNPHPHPHPLLSQAPTDPQSRLNFYASSDPTRNLDLSPLLYWTEQMLCPDPSRRRKMRRVTVGIADWNQERERRVSLWMGRRNSFGGVVPQSSGLPSSQIMASSGGVPSTGGVGLGLGTTVHSNSHLHSHANTNLQQRRVPLQTMPTQMQMSMQTMSIPLPMHQRVAALAGGQTTPKEPGLRRTTAVINRSGMSNGDISSSGAALASWSSGFR